MPWHGHRELAARREGTVMDWSAFEPPPVVMPEARILRIQPGDAIVLKFDGLLSMQQQADVRVMMNDAFPGVPVLVLDEGTELAVLRKD
jgi:hypothetical protein